MKKTIDASVIKTIETVKFNNVVTAATNTFKFTKEETYYAMKLSARIRKLAAQRMNCKYHDVSNKECLAEAYKRIKKQKMIKSGILTKDNRLAIERDTKKEFGICFQTIVDDVKKYTSTRTPNEIVKSKTFFRTTLMNTALLASYM